MSQPGIYLHIPFCRSRCSYCDFATGLHSEELADRYVNVLVKEISSSKFALANFDSIYFGGGTPSLLTPWQLEKILSALHSSFSIETRAEVTLEMNPGTLSVGLLKEFRRLGINRASFGAQTFDDRELSRLGRSHSTADTMQTYEDLRTAGFENVSFDLIAGLPGQSLEGWLGNVDRALSLRPEHLSFYLLEVHSGTPLAEHIKRGLQPEPDGDLAAIMYEEMLERASDAGYQHYEISNLCLPGRESVHNTKYWSGDPYIGFGCSAHSYDGQRRRWSNLRGINEYIEAIDIHGIAVDEVKELTDEDIRAEAVFLGMRLMRGIDAREYLRLFDVDLYQEHQGELDHFREAGLLELEGDQIRLTRSGALLSNEVFATFI